MSVRSALQINLHPLDARLVSHTLKHQLQTWNDQVERVSLTIDTKRSRNGRYRGTAYEESRKRLFATRKSKESRGVSQKSTSLKSTIRPPRATRSGSDISRPALNTRKRPTTAGRSMPISTACWPPMPTMCCIWTATCCSAGAAKRGSARPSIGSRIRQTRYSPARYPDLRGWMVRWQIGISHLAVWRRVSRSGSLPTIRPIASKA
jgi:hypothetical protein